LEEYTGMGDGARATGAVGVSYFDWTATVATAWPSLSGYDVRGGC
jgi:hypothetical protein